MLHRRDSLLAYGCPSGSHTECPDTGPKHFRRRVGEEAHNVSVVSDRAQLYTSEAKCYCVMTSLSLAAYRFTPHFGSPFVYLCTCR